jgi:formylglycine-generating enzyme required for sulfatase activity
MKRHNGDRNDDTRRASGPTPPEEQAAAPRLTSQSGLLRESTPNQVLVQARKNGALMRQRGSSVLLGGALHDLANADTRKTIDRLLQRGAALYRKGDIKKAFRAFRAVLRRDPTVTPALEGAAWSAFAQGKYALAQALVCRLPERLTGESFTVELEGADLEGADLEMAPIAGGRYLMGATDAQMELARDAELETMPRLPDTQGRAPGDMDRIARMLQPHPVKLSGFSLSRRCVSNAELGLIMPGGRYDDRIPDLDGPMDPAVCSWEQADRFCRFLTWHRGLGMFRLPTEAEWEYVARGWPSIREPAGRFSLPEVDASRPAFTDMRGMVYQWCVDYYSDDAYGSAVSRDPFGPKTGSSRVVRGGTFGCWDDNTCLLPWNRSESSQCAFELGEDDSPLCTCVTGFRLVCVYDRSPAFLELAPQREDGP